MGYKTRIREFANELGMDIQLEIFFFIMTVPCLETIECSARNPNYFSITRKLIETELNDTNDFIRLSILCKEYIRF